ncbi:hypothetical protein HD554DRAFT_2120012 [Boletus coccyginus]|nr:hypothetical protein HD554DRAFT_2120012 [Boletus coccyginus]
MMSMAGSSFARLLSTRGSMAQWLAACVRWCLVLYCFNRTSVDASCIAPDIAENFQGRRPTKFPVTIDLGDSDAASVVYEGSASQVQECDGPGRSSNQPCKQRRRSRTESRSEGELGRSLSRWNGSGSACESPQRQTGRAITPLATQQLAGSPITRTCGYNIWKSCLPKHGG